MEYLLIFEYFYTGTILNEYFSNYGSINKRANINNIR